ncbi:hypothetical protein Zmor_017753 [Zophobas morio]|uniref:Uncharacterized protein n=1 Tax=Zophobas morio TaxID=2755281 RepID=A0AA38I903_9CUCU|nr:hypothetical protein Zmor_017753 [Zophobas morio]
MGDQVQQILQSRSNFIKHLNDDLVKNDEIIESTASRLNDLKITTANVQELGKKVEHPALIPLGKKIYVNGTIVHTGEYFLDKLAFPDSYTTLETLDDTIRHLENKIKIQSELLQKSEDAKTQLDERIALITGGTSDEDDASPKQIVTDKGVAVKVGEFYEILEFEN